jgi:uncharacterized membrane protein
LHSSILLLVYPCLAKFMIFLTLVCLSLKIFSFSLALLHGRQWQVSLTSLHFYLHIYMAVFTACFVPLILQFVLFVYWCYNTSHYPVGRKMSKTQNYAKNLLKHCFLLWKVSKNFHSIM